MDFFEKTVRKNYVYQGKIINVRSDDCVFDDGKPCKREVVEHSGGACVLYQENGKFLFVKQYRYAYGEELLEIPAGKLEKGEAPSLTAIRELEEETGRKVGFVKELFVMYPTPGYTNEKIYIYYAENGETTRQHLDDGEYLSLVWLDEAEVKEKIRSGEIKDGKTLVALLNCFAGVK